MGFRINYALLLVILAALHVVSLTYFMFSLFSREKLRRKGSRLREPHLGDEGIHQAETLNASVDMQSWFDLLPEDAELMRTPRLTLPELGGPLGMTNIRMGSRRDAHRLSPPNGAAAEGVQIDEKIMAIIGGYVDSFKNVSRSIQFFNIASQEWLPDTIDLPDVLGETHQGITFDPKTRTIYIISGQKGPGCMPATKASARFDIDTQEFEFLPPLPMARYAPGVEIITDPRDSSLKHLHVFGGAFESRNQTATDHWRLKIDEDGPKLQETIWESLEPVPDAGTHGVSFVSPDGFLHYTAFCTLDPGAIESPSMAECHVHAAEHAKQLLHHVSDAGLAFRYPTAFAERTDKSEHSYWERLADMPFPLCHAGAVYLDGKLHIIGGGILTLQTRRGSAPTSLSVIQTFDPKTNAWQASSFTTPKRTRLFLVSTWIDHDRQTLFSLHPGKSLVMADLSDESSFEQNISFFTAMRSSFLQRTRSLAIGTFNGCVKRELEAMPKGNRNISIHTLFDQDYDQVRGTWNRRNFHKQYPDIVVFPATTKHVSMLVQCATRTGHHVCGRNGKHSFDGNTCTHGIAIDVSRLGTVEVVNVEMGMVRLGAGLTLGRVAVELAPHGLTLPMGTCATVGVTGLTLNGGQGPLSRLHGMTSDHLKSMELVNPHGDVIHATAENEFSDYFWLARGGGTAGQHFPGIITGLEFAGLPKIPRNDTTWTRVRVQYRPTVHKAVEVLLAWQAFYLEAGNLQDPLFPRITAEPWLFMQYKKKKKAFEPALFIIVYFFGDESLHDEFIQRYLPVFETMVDGAITKSIERFNDLQFHRKVGGVKTDAELASGTKGHDLNKMWKGLSAVATKRVSKEAFRSLAETIFLADPIYRRYAEFKPLGGAIRDMDKRETAFWHRDALWWVLTSHFYEPADPVDEILTLSTRRHKEFVDQMGASFGGSYAGYADHGNSTARDLALYCGGNADRIVRIKRDRDPHNLFRNYLPNTIQNQPFRPEVTGYIHQ
jgi:FAD/FMN-containing dehydrogenase